VVYAAKIVNAARPTKTAANPKEANRVARLDVPRGPVWGSDGVMPSPPLAVMAQKGPP
jgi:hypothetical protein